jgi:hypothetical protein
MARKKPPPKPEQPEYIYVLRLFDYYKIGRTWNVERRMKTLFQTLLPESPTLVISSRVYNGKKVEKLLHDQYATKRIRGEWFLLSSQDITEIQEILKSKEELCACIVFDGGPPRMCKEAIKLWREMGNLSHKPTLSESDFMRLPYVRHFSEI